MPRLHDDVATALAVLLGGPLAGGVNLRSNFAALDRSRAGDIAFVLSVAYTLLMVGLTYLLPDMVAWLAVMTMICVNSAIYYYLIYKFFDNALEVRKMHDHKAIYPMWRGIAIGIMAGVLVFTLFFIYNLLYRIG